VDDPWELGLDSSPAAPSFVGWVEPAGPEPSDASLDFAVDRWRSGMDPLASTLLVQAVEQQALVDPVVAAFVVGRENLDAGFEALVARWLGSDGRAVPPATDPEGITVERIDDVLYDGLAG